MHLILEYYILFQFHHSLFIIHNTVEVLPVPGSPVIIIFPTFLLANIVSIFERKFLFIEFLCIFRSIFFNPW